MKLRKTRSPTADLFAAQDASPLTPAAASSPAAPGPKVYAVPGAWKAGGIPPTPQTLARMRPKRLWYAAVFPELPGMQHSASVLRRLCLHAQRFTSFVSIEPPNALLLEIRGSLKLLGPLERLHAGIDSCWREVADKALAFVKRFV